MASAQASAEHRRGQDAERRRDEQQRGDELDLRRRARRAITGSARAGARAPAASAPSAGPGRYAVGRAAPEDRDERDHLLDREVAFDRPQHAVRRGAAGQVGGAAAMPDASSPLSHAPGRASSAPSGNPHRAPAESSASTLGCLVGQCPRRARATRARSSRGARAPSAPAGTPPLGQRGPAAVRAARPTTPRRSASRHAHGRGARAPSPRRRGVRPHRATARSRHRPRDRRPAIR